MNNKHQKTLIALQSKPIPANIKWNDIESLFIHLGAVVSEGNGSRVRIKLNGISLVLHRPHPKREVDKGAIITIIKFLKMAGIYDNEI